ncbi:major facilitator superfamily transporter [Nocardia nova SH22a]|uniref:Major facilitator superfamily transporter n=1 Tax=Nocardia nova SH22a TaxID=1415166 RepID=W5TPP6_9NOCA|nr:MFS transporter [Nocardia nova]AHH21345.1 major facilitator superfamily transporter [Nocardia nova SH22a]
MTSQDTAQEESAAASGPSGRSLIVIVATVFLMHTSLMAVVPLIAPLSREIGIPEWQMGAIVSAAALCVAVAGPAWGRLSQRVGTKTVLVIALASGALAMAGFAAGANAGITGSLGAGAVFAILFVTRGIWFGLTDAAVAPTAQAYVASVTTDPAERVKGMAAVGVAGGLAMVAGPALGGLLGGLSLVVVLWAVPVLLGCTLAFLALTLPPHEPEAEPVKPRRLSIVDERVWPFFVATFGLYTALGFFDVLIGFIVQDRLGYGPEKTALVAGTALLLAGVGLVVSQGALVRVLHWQPGGFVLGGAAIAALGFGLIIIDGGLATILVGIFFGGIGMGLAMPGIAGAASLAVESDEQGSAAGLLASSNAITLIVSPLAATIIYGMFPRIPSIVTAGLCALVAVFVFLHPAFQWKKQPVVADQA